MFVPFESLSPASRIWIFQSDRPFSAQQLKVANERLRTFVEEWAAHGIPLKTSYKIEFNQFIVLAADESHHTASGCSIDSSVRVLKDLEAALGVDLFNRNLVAFRQDDRITLVALQELKEKFRSGILKADALTFNNLVSTKAEFESGWIAPAERTWLRRYIPNELANVK